MSQPGVQILVAGRRAKSRMRASGEANRRWIEQQKWRHNNEERDLATTFQLMTRA